MPRLSVEPVTDPSLLNKIGSLQASLCLALLVPNYLTEIWVVRDGITLSFKTRIAKRDEKRVTNYHVEDEASPTLVGLQVTELTKELRERFDLLVSLRYGVVILSVEAQSRASAAKIRTGDVLMEINRIPIHDVTTYRAAMNQAVKGNKILLLLNRKGSDFFTTL